MAPKVVRSGVTVSLTFIFLPKTVANGWLRIIVMVFSLSVCMFSSLVVMWWDGEGASDSWGTKLAFGIRIS